MRETSMNETHLALNRWFCRNALMVAVFNSATDWYAGFVVFSGLGYMATIMKTEVKDVATDGRVHLKITLKSVSIV